MLSAKNLLSEELKLMDFVGQGFKKTISINLKCYNLSIFPVRVSKNFLYITIVVKFKVQICIGEYILNIFFLAALKDGSE